VDIYSPSLSHLSESEAVTQDTVLLRQMKETDSFPRTNTCWDRRTKSRPPLVALGVGFSKDDL